MRTWNRPQDYIALVAGVYAFLSPIWTSTTTSATWTMVILGIVTALLALRSLSTPAEEADEYGIALLGILFFIAPWVMGFAAVTGIAWTAWVVGVVTFVVGAAAIPTAHRLHTGVVRAH